MGIKLVNGHGRGNVHCGENKQLELKVESGERRHRETEHEWGMLHLEFQHVWKL